MALKVSDVIATRFNEVANVRERIEKPDFSFTLNKLDEENLAERLSGLVDDITVSGKKLIEHMDLKDLKHYRSLIGEFINEVVTHSHKFTRENFLDRRGRHRVYGIVKVINQDLDDLAQELLKNEKDTIKVLDKIDEINGLLLDLLA